MKYLICGRGKPEELEFVSELIRQDIGMELQSYGLEGIASEEEWQKRFQMHQQFRQRFPGYLAVHGPFIGVNFCHPDHLFRDAVHKRLNMIRDIGIKLNAGTLVLHSGLSTDVTKFNIMNEWIRDTVLFWRKEISRYAESGLTVVLENIVDDNPAFLKAVIDQVDHPNLKICLDTGHVNVWSTISLEEWLQELGTRITHIHLHNNNGRADQHCTLDNGNLNLRKPLAWIARNLPDVCISMEMMGSSDELIRNVEIARSVTG